MLKARYDAVIVGAGVIGTSIALELSRLGYSTLNIDRNKSAGYGTTSFSSGIVRTTYSTLEATKFSWECFHMWKQWDDIVQPTQGEDSLIFRQHPGVFLMNGISKGFLEKCMENSRVLGIPFEKVSTKELEDRFDLETIQFGEPRKIDDPLFGEGCGKCEYGVIFPMMGYINDPQYATTTLKRATERSGGDFLFSKTVTGVNVSPDKTISGVELNDGSTVQAPIVINAAGPHSSFINRMAFERNNIKSDATVGTRPLRVEVAYLPIVGSSREIPFSGDPEVGVYWRPDPGGKKMVSRVSTMSEAEQCIKRIQSHRGVKSVFVINNRGQTIKSSVNNPEEERRYAGLISELTKKTQSMVRELDSENSLKFLRIRTNTEEIMIAPEQTENKYTLIVVQDPDINDDPVPK
mmetsp:Transcript_16831/g.28882  ORF Transcript_16831/g.28882 Transcript_16831/m.28882 type:complete len:407 (-) Transcript_16831:1821-3041(-)